MHASISYDRYRYGYSDSTVTISGHSYTGSAHTALNFNDYARSTRYRGDLDRKIEDFGTQLKMALRRARARWFYELPRRFVWQACLAAPLVLSALGCSTAGGPPVIEIHARTALSIMADVIDPAYALAVRGCKDRQGEVMASAESDGGLTVAQAETQLAAIRVRCRRAVAAFDEIRTYHRQATKFVKDGEINEAEIEIEKLRVAWRTLQERTGDP